MLESQIVMYTSTLPLRMGIRMCPSACSQCLMRDNKKPKKNADYMSGTKFKM
ncbi:MAG: hypothetical protein HYV59_03305 [Planctomycetes bacterium]|nr:hypothetical protein [Planctomycetota bacterium]